MNAFVIYISLSTVILLYFKKFISAAKVLFPYGSFLDWNSCSHLFFVVLGKIFSWKHSVIGALIMCAGFGNTSFVGIPVIQALYGEEA